MSDTRPPALVLGLGVHGLAVVRSLGRYGVPVDVADPDPTQPQRHSRFLRQFLPVESIEDDRLVDALLAYGRRSRNRTVLFLTMDRTVPVISAHRAALHEYFDFTLAPAEVITELMDKTRLPAFLARCGARYPATHAVRAAEDIEAVADTIGFPCIVKPAVRTHGFKAAVVTTRDALATACADASRHSDTLVAQEWIPGEDSDVYFCFAYLGTDGAPKGMFVGRKLRQYPRGTGIAAAAEGCNDDFVHRETARLFQHAGYRGFGSTEFRRHPVTGEYYFIEFTVGRTDYNVGCAVANGVDLPVVGYRDTTGAPVPRAPLQHNSRVWVDLGRLVPAILAAHRDDHVATATTCAALACAVSPRNTFTLFDRRDLKPFVAQMARRGMALPRAVRRRAQAQSRTHTRIPPCRH
ncbi:hypothetical protein L6Q96_09320 [Candidatus Binatia bacterium]|nr:hypothetical protein [Candidatus Binatia bacterium]